MSDIRELKARLVMRLPELAARWFPGGRRDGDRYWPRSTRKDKIDSSMCIDIAGATAGRFKDFGDPDLKGDAIDLVAYAEFGCMPPDGRKEAIQWIKDYLGERVAPSGKADWPPAGARGEDAQRAEELEQKTREEKAAKARGLWLHAQDARGTHGEAYLAARGIDIRQLKRHPGAIRFKMLEHQRGGPRYPALVTCMTNETGVIRAVHMTFLDPKQPRKASLSPAKKMFGDVRGCSIRISRGITGLSPEDYKRRIAAGKMIADDELVIVEGIEDALTWAAIDPDARVCAAGSLSLIGGAPLFDCAARITIIGDNDENEKTRAALDAEAHKIKARAAGRFTQLLLPTRDKDLNAAWLADGCAA